MKQRNGSSPILLQNNPEMRVLPSSGTRINTYVPVARAARKQDNARAELDNGPRFEKYIST